MFESGNPASTPPIWHIAALVRAIADALQARFNPVAVQGEISGFSRASSGHCYFTLKDPQAPEAGQIRCAMFRRAALLLDFQPRDGEQVALRGRLDVYGPRGELQLIAESMTRVGEGALFEQFLRLKAKLQAHGLFDAVRKRPVPEAPRGIGIVTSLQAAALADVVTALRRRVPHIPVVIAPAAVQGANAPAELVAALSSLYRLAADESAESRESIQSGKTGEKPAAAIVDVILLVRGGGSMDDLWAFNDEALARCLADSPVPVISGVGHETDFTIADFVADLRAPTPTAAAEFAAAPRGDALAALTQLEDRQQTAIERHLDRAQQQLDNASGRLARPTVLLERLNFRLAAQQQRMVYATGQRVAGQGRALERQHNALTPALARGLAHGLDKVERLALRLGGIDPHRVLQRGYVWLADADGQPVTRAAQARPGQALRATLADGALDLTVSN